MRKVELSAVTKLTNIVGLISAGYTFQKLSVKLVETF